LVSGSWDRTIVLWDLDTRQSLGPPVNTGGGGQVESVAFSPDGKTLASGGGNGVVLCDGATGQPLGEALATDTSGVKAVAFSPDGRILASGGGSNKVVLWDVAKRQQLGPYLTGHKRWVSSVAFSSDNRTLASLGGDNNIILWDVAAPHRLGQSLHGHSSPVESLAFTPDGATLISCAQVKAQTTREKNQHEIRFWDVATHQERSAPSICTTGRVSQIYTGT
jgi:WD40 repeat protein